MQEKAYVFGADSQDSMELWMKALACAGFDYMKLMVADLQRQIDEIEGIYSVLNCRFDFVQSFNDFFRNCTTK